MPTTPLTIRYSKKNIHSYIFLSLILFSFLDPLIPGARYAKYLTIPACILLIASRDNLRISEKEYLWPFYLYLSATIIYGLIGPMTDSKGNLGDFIFVLAYVMPFAFFKVKINPKMAFKASVIIFILVSGPKLSGGFQLNISGSVSTFEHSEFGFIFAIFSIFFISNKKYNLAIIAIILTLLTLKRVAIIGAIIALFVFYTKNTWWERRTLVALIFSAINIFAIMGMKYIASTDFNSFSMEHFNISSNELLLGRPAMYLYIFDHAGLKWLYGSGPGSVYELTSIATERSFMVLLHSDVLKLAVEYGLIFCVIFFFLLFFAPKNGAEYLVFFNVIMLTDNPLIYSGVMFFLFLFISNTLPIRVPLKIHHPTIKTASSRLP